jgi:peptide/nickel transport system substrate-binding protein
MYANAEVDRLLDEGAATFDEDRLRQVYRRAQELIWKDAPWLWLYDQPEIIALNTRLRNVAPRSDEFLVLWDAAIR